MQDSTQICQHSIILPILFPPPPRLVHLLLYSQSQILHFPLQFLPTTHNLTFATF